MPEIRIIIGRIFAFTFFAVGIGYFSTSPSYTYHDPGMAMIVISFSHASERKELCRPFTPEEIAELAPNMRRPMDCPRARVPVHVEIVMDDQKILSKSYKPTGLASDGATSIYESIAVEPGHRRITAKLRDSKRQEGFDYIQDTSITLEPRQLLVIDFRKELGGFNFQ